MPAQPSHNAADPSPSRVKRARRLLAGAGISRDDSDDELGYEDYPWEWIYEGNDRANVPNGDAKKRPSQHRSTTDGSAAVSPGREMLNGGKGDAPITSTGQGGRIIGAKMGGFQCRLGDCVLLKAEATNEAWVGLICEFEVREEDEEKMANIMWFSTEKEIKNKQKKRTDYMPVSISTASSW